MDSTENGNSKELEKGSQAAEQIGAGHESEVKFMALSEMSEDMFESQDVKRLFSLSKLIASRGDVPATGTIPDLLGEIMAANILESMKSFTNFQAKAEVFFNELSKGRVNEQDLQSIEKLIERKIFDAFVGWISHCTNPSLIGDQTILAQRKEMAKGLVEKIIGENLLGEKKKVLIKLMQSCDNPATYGFFRDDINKNHGPVDAAVEEITAESRQVFAGAPFIRSSGSDPVPATAAQEGADVTSAPESQTTEISVVQERRVESAEVMYDLPGVLIIDKDGKTLDAFPFVGQIIKMGTHDSNAIKLPNINVFKPGHAAIRFHDGKFEVLGSRETLVCFKGMSNQFISSTPMEVDATRIMFIGDADNRIYFRLATAHQFKEKNVQESFGQRLTNIEMEFENASVSQKSLDKKEQVLKKLQREIETIVARFGDKKEKFDLLLEETETLGDRINLAVQNLEAQKKVEYEEQLPKKSHFDQAAGENMETERPYKYGVIIPEIADGKLTMDIAFPGFIHGENDIYEDGLVLEVAGGKYRYSTGHEFTREAIKPYVQRQLHRSVDLLFSDKNGDKKQGKDALDHLLKTGLISANELNETTDQKGQEKLMTQQAELCLKKILAEEKSLHEFIESKVESNLPYDVAIFRDALDLIQNEMVAWNKVQFPLDADAKNHPRDEYRQLLVKAAGTRLEAYDERLIQIRTNLDSTSLKLMAALNKGKQQQMEAMELELRKLFVEIVSLMELEVTGLTNDVARNQWLATRLSKDQLSEVQSITLVQRTIRKMDSGEGFTAEEIRQTLAVVGEKSYGDFLNLQDAESDSLMKNFIQEKVKAYAVNIFQKACPEGKFGNVLDEVESFIKIGALSYEDLGMNQASFEDLRANEIFTQKMEAGKKVLEDLMQKSEPDFDAMLAFGRKLFERELALTFEDQMTLNAYLVENFARAVGKAIIEDKDRTNVAMMVSEAVGLNMLSYEECSTTEEEIDSFIYYDAMNVEGEKLVEKVTNLLTEVTESGVDVLGPLFELKLLLESDRTITVGGKHGEQILEEAFDEKFKRIMAEAMQAKESTPALVEMLQMVVKDMPEQGFGGLLEKSLKKQFAAAVETLDQENITEEKLDALRNFFKTLGILDIKDIATPIAASALRYRVENFGHASPDNSQIHTGALRDKLMELGF